MIVFLLLVIIAILLFGSSAVIGAIGTILGFIVLVLALFFGSYAISSVLGVEVADVIMYGCFALLGFALLAAALGPKKAPTQTDPKTPFNDRPPSMPSHVREAIELDRRLREEHRAKIEKRRTESG